MRTGKATIRRNRTALIVGFLMTARKVKAPRQQITAATAALRWTRMRLKTLNIVRVGTGITAPKLKKTRTASGLYAAICVAKLCVSSPSRSLEHQ